MTTAGNPGNVTPATSMPGALRCATYQMPGTENSKCGSLASIARPDAVCDGATTQLLLPGKPSRGQGSGGRGQESGSVCVRASLPAPPTSQPSPPSLTPPL